MVGVPWYDKGRGLQFATCNLWEPHKNFFEPNCKMLPALPHFEKRIVLAYWALKLMCTQYGLCGPGGLQECKDNFIFWAGWSMFSGRVHKRFCRVAQGLQVTYPQPLCYHGTPSLKRALGYFSVWHWSTIGLGICNNIYKCSLLVCVI